LIGRAHLVWERCEWMCGPITSMNCRCRVVHSIRTASSFAFTVSTPQWMTSVHCSSPYSDFITSFFSLGSSFTWAKDTNKGAEGEPSLCSNTDGAGVPLMRHPAPLAPSIVVLFGETKEETFPNDFSVLAGTGLR